MPTFLRLYEDILAGGADDMRLPALPRMIFVVHGAATIGGQTFADGEAWAGEGAADARARPAGRHRLALRGGSRTARPPARSPACRG